MSEAIKAIEDTMKAVKAVTKPDMLLWLDSNRGVYIPRDFAKSFNAREKAVSGVSAEDWATLEAGPDHEWYWEAWTKVLDNAIVTDENGVKYSVHQDGDCWLIPEGMEWNDDEGGFAWPSEEEGEDEEGPAIFQLTAHEVAEQDEDLIHEYMKRREFRLAGMNSQDRGRMLDAIVEEKGIKGGWFFSFPGEGVNGPYDSREEALTASKEERE